MADLDLRTARTVLEQAILQQLLLAYGVRQPAVATIAALRSVVSLSTPLDTLRFCTAKGVCYQWKRFAIGSDNGDTIIQPADVSGSNPGRWLKTISTVISGYAKTVLIYQGDLVSEIVLNNLLGQRPAFLIFWSGARHKSSSLHQGVLSWYINTFEIWCFSTNLRNNAEAQEGTKLAADFAIDPGVIAMIGDAKLILAGSDLGLSPAVDILKPLEERIIVSDLNQKTFIQKLVIEVWATIQWPENPPTVLVGSLAAQYELAETPRGPQTIGNSNYLVSGYGVPLGSGFTKTPSSGSAYVGTTLISSAPVAFTFAANMDTYRDLRTDGSFVYTSVGNNSTEPSVSAATLRVGKTVTDAVGVALDKIVCNSLIPYITDILPAPGTAISALNINPSAPAASVSSVVQFACLATYTTGAIVDVTTLVTWQSTMPTVATISTTGLVSCLLVGTSNISASLNSVTSNISILTVS